MCAINGFSFEDRELLQKMNYVTAHRGPDGSGIYCQDGVSLGHNRLSIIDLDARSSQPMENSAGLVITYNGELYNYKEIKEQITLKNNYGWKTESDTEVILAAYELWGAKCLEKFNGIFAFVIWDSKRKELFIARDQMGVKPLYYYYKNNKLIFSSELKAILEHPVPRDLDREAYNHYLNVLFTPGPYTLIKDIKKFPPAHYAVFKNNSLEITRYWGLPQNKEATCDPEDLNTKVKAAVNRQLVSDRPVGLYLSGGIDSSVVLASLKDIKNEVDTFSVGFDLGEGEQSEKFNADFNLARKTAEFFQTNHHEVILSSSGLIDKLQEAVWHLDEPLGNATVIPQLALGEFAKKSVTVALTGDGGDELFGGYPRYQKYRRLLSLLRKFPGILPPTFEYERAMFQKDAWSLLSVKNGLELSREFFAKYFSPDKAHRLKNRYPELVMRTDRETWLIDECLLRTDKMNMKSGVEARVPLLDRELVEFAATITLSQKLAMGGKGILKQAFAKELPEYLFRQEKRGFFSPAAKWLRRPEFVDLCRDLFVGNEQKLKLLEEHINKTAYHAPILWALLSFHLWAKRYKVSI